MNYSRTETAFPSSDGKNTIYAEIYTPKESLPKGIVQLVHGMIDYTGRYRELADNLTANGYILAGHHHLGHGRTAATPDDLGYFADRDGYKYVIEDVHKMNRYLHDTFPSLSVYLLGHSMGSFISRLYAAEHPHGIDGFIIHGTAGPNPLCGMGRLLAGAVKGLKGPRHRSSLISGMAFGSYNKRFPKEEGHNAWLTRDPETVADRDSNAYTSFEFTVSAYIDLFRLLSGCNSKQWYRKYPKKLPTLIMSGTMDPVGNYGKGPKHVYKQLLIKGVDRIELKLYEGARHELFNETNREEVYRDIVSWLDGVKG